jgi:hypothetical protein
MHLTSIDSNKRSEMFSVFELRLIRHCVGAEIQRRQEELRTVDPESDRSVELANDLVVLRNIRDKISEREDV